MLRMKWDSVASEFNGPDQPSTLHAVRLGPAMPIRLPTPRDHLAHAHLAVVAEAKANQWISVLAAGWLNHADPSGLPFVTTVDDLDALFGWLSTKVIHTRCCIAKVPPPKSALALGSEYSAIMQAFIALRG